MRKYRHTFLGDECPLAIVAAIRYSIDRGNKATSTEPHYPPDVEIDDVMIEKIILTPHRKDSKDIELEPSLFVGKAIHAMEGWLMDLAENDERLIEKLIEKARE